MDSEYFEQHYTRFSVRPVGSDSSTKSMGPSARWMAPFAEKSTQKEGPMKRSGALEGGPSKVLV